MKFVSINFNYCPLIWMFCGKTTNYLLSLSWNAAEIGTNCSFILLRVATLTMCQIGSPVTSEALGRSTTEGLLKRKEQKIGVCRTVFLRLAVSRIKANFHFGSLERAGVPKI